MAIDIPDITPDFLSNRFAFLIDRAETRRKEGVDPTLETARRATLLRDAACVALLQGETAEARKLLIRAGIEFLMLGLPFGAALIALAKPGSARNSLQPFANQLRGIAQQERRSKAPDEDGGRDPLATTAHSAPPQLFALQQAEWLTNHIERIEFLNGEPMRAVLERNGGYQAGLTGLTIESYSDLARQLVEAPTLADLDARPTPIQNVSASRAERLRAAQKDTFHWRQLPRPAELIDLDAVALLVLALRAEVPVSTLANLMRSEIPMVDLPLQIAIALNQDQGPQPLPQAVPQPLPL